MLKKMAERRAFVLFGARNVSMKIRWSAERCHMSERGTLKKKASERGVPIQKWAGARSARNPRTGPTGGHSCVSLGADEPRQMSFAIFKICRLVTSL